VTLQPKYPDITVHLTGKNGNAFNVLGLVKRELKGERGRSSSDRRIHDRSHGRGLRPPAAHGLAVGRGRMMTNQQFHGYGGLKIEIEVADGVTDLMAMAEGRDLLGAPFEALRRELEQLAEDWRGDLPDDLYERVRCTVSEVE
jgi:hypothetical protein